MNDLLCLATAQSSISADVCANGSQIRALMREASEKGARIIHFPEAALSGYPKAQIKDWQEVDWTALEEELASIEREAARLGIWVVLGCNHRLESPKRPHNSLYVISDRGEIVHRYDKRYCSHTEVTDWYTPGTEPLYFEVDGFRFGCVLCIEINFMEVFAHYEKMQADCILFSAYSEDPVFGIQAQGYAATNNFWISVSTPAQCSHSLTSGLIDPRGYIVAQCEKNVEPQILIQTLNRKAPALEIALTKARPWRREARKGDIYAQVFAGGEDTS
ncbi:carbon-nitrogen hydrolase family protein [Kiloniella sp.]|uniref:carbon-nitrogen hydrolase family protein n=1 Tax=Kiloniella sp. TaxID=1938587 RepID=UPI003B01ABBD